MTLRSLFGEPTNLGPEDLRHHLLQLPIPQLLLPFLSLHHHWHNKHNTSFIHSFPERVRERDRQRERGCASARSFSVEICVNVLAFCLLYPEKKKKVLTWHWGFWKKNISQFELVMVTLGKGNACLFQSSNVRSNNWSLCSKLLLRLRSNLLSFFYYSFFLAILFATPIIIWCFGFTGSVFSL